MQRLLDINRAFYEQFARQFADARSTGQASVRAVLATIADGERVLDVGCGDGRVARALDEMGRSVSYTGVDGSESFVTLARQRAEGLRSVSATFICADVAQADWMQRIAAGSFDCVLSLAVLHHIPGAAARQRLVQQMADGVAPSGRLIASTWQFMSSERLRKKIVPWSSAGIDETRLDEGDYLLNWERGGHGLRYCHLIGEDDLRTLCAGAGLAVTDSFLADNGLNLYVVAKRS
jgi:tRNA (uracil-5-)-methyltransferase TRM9